MNNSFLNKRDWNIVITLSIMDWMGLAATEYFNHPVLGPRLREITNALLLHKNDRTILQLMGS